MTSAAKRKLPLGIQSFRNVREDGCYYVDKTAYARRLVEEGAHYLLTRPRRFGKSLFVDTLKELFEGNEPLFRGLAIHEAWDWSAARPVIRLDFGGGAYRSPDGVRNSVAAQLDAIERAAGVQPRYETPPERFRHLIRALHEASGRRVAVLVDEYDKPILEALDDPERARANRDFLRGFYGTVKSADAHVRFSFFTGVSKFTRVSLFSDLNNLTDITLDPSFANVCGYTEADLDDVFAPELPGIDRERIRDWYNGYNWLGEERVYNPFDILLFFRTRQFRAHWFETGSPDFAVQMLKRRRVVVPSLDGLFGTGELLSKFDVENMAVEALLFQAGYLTIAAQKEVGDEPLYRLGYPNREVRQSLNRGLLEALAPAETNHIGTAMRLRELLAANDFAGIEALFRAFFAGIPYEWHTRNDIARYEGYYASVFYSHFAAAGLDVATEDSSSRGRVDMAVRFEGRVYLFELKVVELTSAGSALEQLRDRDYAAKYRAAGEPVYLIGVEFSREERNVTAFEVAEG